MTVEGDLQVGSVVAPLWRLISDNLMVEIIIIQQRKEPEADA